MSTESLTQLYYWVRVALVALAVLVALALVLRQSRRRQIGPLRAVGRTVLPAIALAGTVLLVDPPVSVPSAAIAGVLGLAVGFLLGRRSGGYAVLSGWVTGLAVVLGVLTLTFGSMLLVGAAVVVWALAAGVALGAAVAVLIARPVTTPTPSPAPTG